MKRNQQVEVVRREIRSLPAAPQVPTPGEKVTNWANIGECRPRQHSLPTTTAEVQNIVRKLASTGTKATVRGSGMAPNGLFFTDQAMIHTHGLTRILDIQREKRLVRCQGGCTLRQIQEALAAHQLELPILPSVLHLSIGGSIGMCAHGSSLSQPSLSGYVAEIVLVDGQGNLLVINDKTNSDLFPAVKSHCGVLGVVVEVVLRVQPLAQYHSITSPITLTQVAKVIQQRVVTSHSYRLWYYPHVDKCSENIVRKLPDADEARDDAQSTVAASVRSTASRNTANDPNGSKLDGVITTLDRKFREGDHLRQLDNAKERLASRAVAALRGNWLRHQVTEAAMAAATVVPSLQPFVNKAFFAVFCNHTFEEVGSIEKIMTMDCLFSQHALEFSVPVERTLDALNLARNIIESENLKAIHFPIEIRFCDAEDPWLSPAYQRKSCYIGLVQYRPYARYESPDTATYYSRFAQEVRKIGGRPHLAKYCENWNDTTMAASFPKWNDFKAIQKKLDPKGVFLSDWYKRRSSL